MHIVTCVTGGMVTLVIGLCLMLSPLAADIAPLMAPGEWLAERIHRHGTPAEWARLFGTGGWSFLIGCAAIGLVFELRKWKRCD